MTETFRNLESVETGYTVFEKDQVLTPGQLNGLAEYLADQERLTRVALIGVGIACGLWPSIEAGAVKLSHGTGVTTDGDLMVVPEDVLYDRYKRYGESAPKYPPLYNGGAMLPAFELVPKGQSDERALPLSRLGDEDRQLEAMAAVLLVESHLHDPDLCTGTDCDNRGMQALHRTRLLLVDAKTAAALAAGLDTPASAARTPLVPVLAARPALKGAPLRSSAELAAVYRKACAGTLDELAAAFKAFYRPCRWFIEDLFPADPAPRWTKVLKELGDQTPERFAQYYYDFLKDLAETWNAFLDAIFDDRAVCCPDLDAFPKHLVLGALDPAQRGSRERTGFYPSPAVAGGGRQRTHARFLVRKLDALIAAFVPAEVADVRITPSRFEDRSLEERAIPFYYDPAAVNPVWNFGLTRRGSERHNYSYHADRYEALGAARRPLEAQTGAFPFFRIEGHVGKPLAQVRQKLETQIRDANLPIEIEYVRFDKPPRGWRPPRHNLDLYRLHHLLRADVALQLADTDKFGERFLQQVKTAAGTIITDADNGNVPVVGSAQTKTELLGGQVKMAMQKVAGAAYDASWQEPMSRAAQTAAELAESFSTVTKKDFVSPLDQLIAGQPARWLGWLDTLVADAEDKESTGMQLTQFLGEHPGLEHYAGALRGGTFVLVCDQADMVLADFMLPYGCCQPRAEPPKPPVLPPPVRPEIVFDKPIRLVALPDKFRFDKLRDDLVVNVQKDLDQQKRYFDGLKDTIGIFVGSKPANLVGGAGGASLPGGNVTLPGAGALPVGNFSDPVLGMHATDTAWKAHVVDTVRTQLLDPRLEGETRTALEKQLETSEAELASSILSATRYVAAANIDVKPGSEGAAIMSTASAGLGRVSNIDALVQIEKDLTTLGNRAGTTTEMKTVIGSVLAGRGIR